MKDLKISNPLKKFFDIYKYEVEVNGLKYRAVIEYTLEDLFEVEDNLYYIALVEVDSDGIDRDDTVMFIDLEDDIVLKLNSLKERDFKTTEDLINNLIMETIKYKQAIYNIKYKVMFGTDNIKGEGNDKYEYNKNN